MMLPPYHFASQMWGKNHVASFVEMALPMLLAPNNLPALSNLQRSCFDLYTTSSDLPIIEASPAFQKLRTLVPVTVELIDTMDLSHGHMAMSECHRRAIKKADAKGHILVFLQPDTLTSDGTLAQMQKVLQQGKHVVQVAGFRTLLEEMQPAVRAQYDSQSHAICLTGRELVALSKDRLHPISQSCVWDSPHFSNYNAHIYWRIGEEGFLARCAHYHPLAVYPRHRAAEFAFTIDYNYFTQAVPDFNDYYIATDSDEMFLCEMSRADYFIGDGKERQASALQIGLWMEANATPHHRRAFEKKIYFHTGARESKQWKETELFSDAMLTEAFTKANRSLQDLFGTAQWLPVYKERVRLYYHTRSVTHASDRIWVYIPALLVPFYQRTRCFLGRMRQQARKL